MHLWTEFMTRYVYSDNWGVLTPFKSIQDETVRKVQLKEGMNGCR